MRVFTVTSTGFFVTGKKIGLGRPNRVGKNCFDLQKIPTYLIILLPLIIIIIIMIILIIIIIIIIKVLVSAFKRSLCAYSN